MYIYIHILKGFIRKWPQITLEINYFPKEGNRWDRKIKGDLLFTYSL